MCMTDSRWHTPPPPWSDLQLDSSTPPAVDATHARMRAIRNEHIRRRSPFRWARHAVSRAPSSTLCTRRCGGLRSRCPTRPTGVDPGLPAPRPHLAPHAQGWASACAAIRQGCCCCCCCSPPLRAAASPAGSAPGSSSSSGLGLRRVGIRYCVSDALPRFEDRPRFGRAFRGALERAAARRSSSVSASSATPPPPARRRRWWSCGCGGGFWTGATGGALTLRRPQRGEGVSSSFPLARMKVVECIFEAEAIRSRSKAMMPGSAVEGSTARRAAKPVTANVTMAALRSSFFSCRGGKRTHSICRAAAAVQRSGGDGRSSASISATAWPEKGQGRSKQPKTVCTTEVEGSAAHASRTRLYRQSDTAAASKGKEPESIPKRTTPLDQTSAARPS
mmetsp:Transcript_25416/g.73249  ORF Transcript_25416/g.73249 Transcript_25416/m.73249 type:complete len:391 (+) Transcript_25416:141-1313(+)